MLTFLSFNYGVVMCSKLKLEFGHNWGSEHDPMKPECTPPSGQGGNFIMYSFSNQGYERNNYVSDFIFKKQKNYSKSFILKRYVIY